MYPMSNQWWRLGGGLGIAFIIVFIIGGIILQGEAPLYDDPIEEIREYWVDDGQSYLVGDYLLGLGFLLLFLPFLVVLRELLGRAEGEPQILSRVAFTAGVIALIIGGASSFFWGALAFGDFAETASDDTLRTLMVLNNYGFTTFALGIGTFVLAASLVIALTGVLWRWLGWLGIVVAVLGLIAPLGILSDDPEDIFDILGFLGFIGFAIWLLITSIGLWMRKEAPQTVAA
jgi:uncharacterized protein DUF4386